MNIEITRPELVAFIRQRLRSGAYSSAEDIVAEALLGTCAQEESPQSSALQAKNLVELFASSPFAGLNMNFERNKDTGRDVEL